MPESYKSWDINSVGDAADKGGVAGCGTKEVTNWKNTIDKIGPPNGNRLLEIYTPIDGNNEIVIINNKDSFRANASTMLTQLTNTLDVRGIASSERGLSISDIDAGIVAYLKKVATTQNLEMGVTGAGGSTFVMQQSNGDIGIGGTHTPAGVFHPAKDLSAGLQRGICKNVGPLGTGFTRDTVSPMVNVSDSGVLTDGNSLSFLFSGNYQGMVGHGDIHGYLPGDGNSFYCHFSVRFASETTVSITLDFGDISGGGQKFFVADSGTGIRLLVTASAGPNYNPVIVVKNSFGASVDIAYNFHLRKCIFS